MPQTEMNQTKSSSLIKDDSLVYIARQPIFNASGSVHAYELLYRDTERNAFNPNINGEMATGTIISESILNFGLNELTVGKKAFVNFTNGQLLSKAAGLLNPEQFVIEILENVTYTPDVIVALHNLKAAGFVLALDDYIGSPMNPKIINLFDIIKIDFIATDKKKRSIFAPLLKKDGKILLAEKVETAEDIEEAKVLGCELFQGYYYSKPTMLKRNRRDISSSSFIKLTAELSAPIIDMDRIAYIINWDAHLSYKLLKRMKTLKYNRGNTITSIKSALIMMGDEEIHRWLILVLLRGVTSARSDELIRIALIRAFLCEKLARETNNHLYSPLAFSTGMFSIIHCDPSSPSDDFMELPIANDIKDALTGTDNILKKFLDISLYYESGDWEKLELLADSITPPVNLQILRALYFIAVSSADSMLSKDS